MRTAEAAVADLAAWPSIRSQLDRLQEQIVTHEQAETERIQCAHLDDLGGGG